MRTHTFKHVSAQGEVSATVRSLTYRDELELASLHHILKVGSTPDSTGLHLADWTERRKFAELMVFSKSVKGLGFEWPSTRAPLDTLLTALIKLFDREDSKELMKVWFDAIDLLDSATTDIDLLPPKQLSEERLELPSVAKKRDIWRQNWLDEFDKQIAEEAAIKKALDKGETPTVDFSDLSDFGLHYNTKEEINFTLDRISFLENYGILPGVGGLEDQDRKRVHDMTILRRVMGWRRYLHQYGGLYEVSEDEGFVALDTL